MPRVQVRSVKMRIHLPEPIRHSSDKQKSLQSPMTSPVAAISKNTYAWPVE